MPTDLSLRTACPVFRPFLRRRPSASPRAAQSEASTTSPSRAIRAPSPSRMRCRQAYRWRLSESDTRSLVRGYDVPATDDEHNERRTKSQIGGEGRREWNSGRLQR